jgi:hypothetical protein
MKLCGVEIPADIEIPALDPASKAELDALRASSISDREERKRRREDPRFAGFNENIKRGPLPPHADKPLIFSVEKLRLLSPWARARVLYVMRDQVTD